MRHRLLLWGSLVVAAFILIFPLLDTPVAAQTASTATPLRATPIPTLTGNGGAASWTIATNTFESVYPKGFSFKLNATSSGGKITSASIYWRHGQGGAYRFPAEIDPATGEISYRWAANRARGVPQWVNVEYWWLLTDEAGNTYETPRQYDEYADTTRKWNRAESDDIIVFWEASLPATIGDQVIKAMATQRPFYLQNWGKLLNYRPRIIVYKSPKTWQEWAPDFDYTHIEGETSPEWGGTVQVFSGSARLLAYGVALHEIGHLYQFANGGNYHNQIWFYEGDATYFELAQDYSYLDRVRQWAATGNLPSLQDEGPGRTDREAYDLGYAFWKWFTDTYGVDAHRKVWQLVAGGSSSNDAFEEVTGKKFYDLETAFRTWLGMTAAAPPTAFPTPVVNFPPTPDYHKKATPKP